MKVHTNAFKEQIKEMGRELDSLITFGSTELGAEQLNSVTPSFESSILKSAMKMLEIDSNVEIPKGSVINYKFGVKVNGVYEYLDFGNYIVKEVEKQEDTLSYKIICYDKMLNTMKDYVALQNGTFPMTIRDYINSLCLDCELTFKNASDEFANYDKIIESDLYANLGYTYRDIFDELSAVTGSTICLDNEDNVEVRYITDTLDTIDEEYLKDINVNFGEKFGPVNSIVLSRSGESDNVYLQDKESVTSNGLTELKIIDNQIMNFNNRADFLPDLLSKLNGLEYYLNDFSSTGITYYDICDRYNVRVYDKEYSCVMFNNEMLVTQGLEENIFTERPEETKTDYSKSDKDDRRINQVYIIVDKQKQEINLVASKKVGKDEVVSTINQSAEQITLKGNRIVIESDNFNLTADGTVQAVAGEIAGFNISNEGFYYLLQPKKDYKDADFTKLNNYIIGTGTLTDDEKYLYDMNNDNVLNAQDLVIMDWTIRQKISKSSPGKFQIKIPEKGKNPFLIEFGLYNGLGQMIHGFEYDKSTLENLNVIGELQLNGKKIQDTIVESGSNTNGSYVKYSDGTMICFGKISGVSSLYDYWEQFKRTEEDIEIYFPATFKTSPYVTANGTNASGIFTVLIGGTYATYFKFTGLKAKNNTGTSYEIYYQATGKWK